MGAVDERTGLLRGGAAAAAAPASYGGAAEGGADPGRGKPPPRRRCLPGGGGLPNGVPVRIRMAALLVVSQLLCAPLFSVTVVGMSQEFAWDKIFQGHAHSFFFVGYALTGLPGGLLADLRGGKGVLLGSFLIMGVMVASTPFAAAATAPAGGGLGWLLLCSRLLMGLAEGVQSPAILSVVTRWHPRHEQARVLGVIHGGIYSGAVVGFILAPLIIAALGWKSVWYIFGGLILLWCVAWALFATSTPREHPSISRPEREYIEANTSAVAGRRQEGGDGAVHMVPFRVLLQDRAVLAIVVAHFAHDWCWYAAVSWLPTFFYETHGVSAQVAALYSAFPFFVQLATTLMGGAAADWQVQRDPSSALAVRRFFTTLAFCGAGGFLLLSQFVRGNVDAGGGITGSGSNSRGVLVVVCVCAAFGFDGFHVAGYLINSSDIAPKNAGQVKGLGDAAGCLAGFLANIVTGILTHHHGDFMSSFMVFAVLQFVGAAVFLLLADGSPRFKGLRSPEAPQGVA